MNKIKKGDTITYLGEINHEGVIQGRKEGFTALSVDSGYIRAQKGNRFVSAPIKYFRKEEY